MGHRIGTFLLVIGIGVLAWAATVYFWKDPFTTAYTAYEQHELESKLDRRFETWKPAPATALQPTAHAHPTGRTGWSRTSIAASRRGSPRLRRCGSPRHTSHASRTFDATRGGSASQ